MVKGIIVTGLPLYLRPENESKGTYSVYHSVV